MDNTTSYVVTEAASLLLGRYGADAFEKLRRTAVTLSGEAGEGATDMVLAIYVEAKRQAWAVTTVDLALSHAIP